MLVGHVFDAFAHPIIGEISDNTRTRWGRRRVKQKRNYFILFLRVSLRTVLFIFINIHM